MAWSKVEQVTDPFAWSNEACSPASTCVTGSPTGPSLVRWQFVTRGLNLAARRATRHRVITEDASPCHTRLLALGVRVPASEPPMHARVPAFHRWYGAAC